MNPYNREYHLFVVPLGSRFWQALLRFRNFLRSYFDTAHAYGGLKQQLVRHCRENTAYYEGKKSFVEQVFQEAQKENE